jgi:hypothetical protein
MNHSAFLPSHTAARRSTMGEHVPGGLGRYVPSLELVIPSCPPLSVVSGRLFSSRLASPRVRPQCLSSTFLVCLRLAFASSVSSSSWPYLIDPSLLAGGESPTNSPPFRPLTLLIADTGNAACVKACSVQANSSVASDGRWVEEGQCLRQGVSGDGGGPSQKDQTCLVLRVQQFVV